MSELYRWSVEVFDAGTSSAAAWRMSYGAALVEAAITNGAQDWQWHRHPWGVLFEVGFAQETGWPAYRALPVVQAALDAAPDAVNGVLVHRGRGGSSGRVEPRRPHPIVSSGAADVPRDEPVVIRLG